MVRPLVSSLLAIVLALSTSPASRASSPQAPGLLMDPFHRALDDVLDVYVRDGDVYYAALRAERGRLDRYVASLDVAASTYDRWTRDQQAAFWVNAYNAFVLRTVIDHYPIRGQSPEYPAASIRQIPGAFESRRHRAAGRSVTLDEIEQTILAGFDDPRLFLALGRGAAGSGRLLSEAYALARLESQLERVAAEFATSRIRVDGTVGEIVVNPIVGWHETAFAAAYADLADGAFSARSPIERAVVAFTLPHLFPREQEFVRRNTFVVRFGTFDWRLNDLTGGR